MALSEVWRYDPNLEGTPTPFDVWVEPRTNAPIAVATRFRQSGEGIQLVPESTITIRVRWRSDVSSAALWRDPEGYNWLTDGYVEVGRRSWVDLQLTRYGAITAGVLPQVPVEVIPRGSQDGWELRGAEGERISELVIGQFETAEGFQWPSSGRPKEAVRFTVPSGGFTLNPPGFDGELAVQTGWRVEIDGLEATHMWAKSGSINAGVFDAEYEKVRLSLNDPDALAGTAEIHPLLWPSSQAPTKKASFYFGTDDRLQATNIEALNVGDVVRIPGV